MKKMPKSRTKDMYKAVHSIWDIKKISHWMSVVCGFKDTYLHKLKYQTLYRLLHLNFYTLSFS